MANKNFIVHNGLIVGSANIDAATGNANVGNLTTTGQLVSTKTGGTADGNAQIYLNGATLNRIDFNTSGTAAPAFTTRSAGSKIVLYPSTTGSATDYAIGINSATLWQSLPQNDASMYFRWYGGTTEVANLSGTGMLTISGNANVDNLIATAVYTDNYKFANGAAFSVDTSQILNGNSNVKVAANSDVTVAANGAVRVTVAANGNVGIANIAPAHTLSVTGTMNISGNANVGNLGTTSATLIGNLNFSGTGLRITGDFSNATISSRTMFQTSTLNSPTNVYAIPNGSSTTTSFSVSGNNDPGNAAIGQFVQTGTDTSIRSTLTGTGSYTPITFYTSGAEKMRIDANGNVGIGNTAPTDKLSVTGNLNVAGNIIYSANLYQGAQLRYAHAYTASTAAPSGSTVGDYWYDTATDILYLRVSDGTTPLWFDVSSQANTFADTTTTNATITTATITTANVSGNINAANLQNGNSNVRIVANGNVTVSATGTANVVVVTSTGANIAGTANVTGNANVGNLGTAAIVSTANNAGTLVSITDSNSVASSNKALSIVAGTNNLFFTPNSTSGAYNSLVNTNDIVIGFNGQSGQGTGNLTIAGWATTSGGLKFSMVANVTTIISSSNIVPSANATYSLGNTTNRWSNIWGLASSAQYADLAERYASDYDYDPGTVVIFGGNAEITVTNADHDPRIAGVISTNPGYLMNDSADQDALMLPVALTGRVPTRVRGPISKGDMVVSSTEEGVAIRMQKELYEPGCVIGKSLENILDDSIQTIEVVVGRL